MASAQPPGPPPPPPPPPPTAPLPLPGLRSLKQVPVPAVPGVGQYVRNQQALIALGKVFFWDVQAGSDGKTACASCHFHAGADHRRQNQLAPPHSATTALTSPNRMLTAGEFPFHRAGVVSGPPMVAGSAGVMARRFLGVTPGAADENGADVAGNRFNKNGLLTRQVTSRNTPSVINAVFNVRQFWDGRASPVFNGVSELGEADPAAAVQAWRNGRLVREVVRLQNSSLASLAVGPVLNPIEMSYEGRSFGLVGRKLLALRPLGRQRVAVTDSVLGSVANASGNGLVVDLSYRTLIEAAIDPAYWEAPVSGTQNQMEANFSLYWGLAIQAYLSTLVSNDSPLDRSLEGVAGALSPLERQGLQTFGAPNSGSCAGCHAGAEFTAASWTENVRRGGFFRIGVTPIADDRGLGNLPAALARQITRGAASANGMFKTPGLRNVEFTGPFFHDGSQATLEQVLEFYGRNGDFPADGNLGPGMGRIRLSPQERTAVVAFLKALTDDRVRFQRAPFDHPSLCVAVGHEESAAGTLVKDSKDGRFASSAADRFALIPAVGATGSGVPLQTFDELLRGVGNDGTRANTLTQACVP